MQSLPISHRLFPATHRKVLPVAVISSRSSTSTLSFCVRTRQCRCLHSSSLVMDEDRFIEASKSGNLIPLQKTIFSDHLTPVLAYRCLVKEDDREAPSFLFESVEPGFRGSSVGRYSVVGAQPSMEIVAKEHNVTILDHRTGKLTQKTVQDPMTIPRSISEEWKPRLVDELPDTFCGGWVGYFSYDTVRYVENRKLPFLRAPEDDRNLADIQLGLYEDVVVFDHVEKKAHVIHWVRLDQYSSLPEAYLDGKKHLEILVSRVQGIESPRLSPGSVDFCTHTFGPSLAKGNMTSEEYKNAVLQAKEHIAAGDIFQIVLSQRFERRTFADPFEVYRALRIVNQSPYMTYIQARGCILVASSPEILTRVKKVSKPGSVNVEKLMSVEWYFHVMHISSTVSGELLDHLTCWDALRAALPVGTVSGAPKVKAMELIDQLEVIRRGPYSGGFGGISFSGDMDIALALRTMVFLNGARYDTMYSYTDASRRQEWVAHLQSGAGIVADSNPDEEQIECENKVAGLCRAIDMAESAFVKGRHRLSVKINGSVPSLFSRVQHQTSGMSKDRIHEKRN